MFSRNSDYEEVEGKKHPPVIQPVAPLKAKPRITNHLLSNVSSSQSRFAGLTLLLTTGPLSCRVSTNDSPILTISRNRATPVSEDFKLPAYCTRRRLRQARIPFTGS